MLINITHVINDNNNDAIFEASRVSTSLLSKDHGQQEFTKVDEELYALLGSVLGKSVIHMLLDHKAEISYRCVDRVFLVGEKDVLRVSEKSCTTLKSNLSVGTCIR